MKEYSITFYLVDNHRITTKETGRSKDGSLTGMRKGQGYRFVRGDGVYVFIPDHAVVYISVHAIAEEES